MNTKLTQALEAVIPEAAKAPPDYSCSDMGNALRFIAQHGTKVLYCFTAERWYVWNGIVWREDRKGIVTAWAKATVNTIEAEAEACGDPDRAKELLKHSRASQAASRIRALLELARDHVPIEPDEIDADQDLLNCQNGQLDLRTGILSPHAPDQLCTKITRASYLPDAPCTVWPAFLARIFAEDDDLIGFVQRLVGYGVTGSTAEQCLAILHGGGANGKSTFANAVSHVLGDYSKAAAPSLLTEQRSGMDRHPTEVADLKGCRLAVCQESGESGRLPETRVKQLTGGDPIKARHMGKDFFEFQPTHKLWLCTNHRPAIRGTDLAIWRRILLVPFEVTIPPEERDPRLEQKL
jgi:putative DNA primase/helicase